MIKISEEEASFKGQLVRELIARVTSDHLIGQKFKNGRSEEDRGTAVEMSGGI